MGRVHWRLDFDVRIRGRKGFEAILMSCHYGGMEEVRSFSLSVFANLFV